MKDILPPRSALYVLKLNIFKGGGNVYDVTVAPRARDVGLRPTKKRGWNRAPHHHNPRAHRYLEVRMVYVGIAAFIAGAALATGYYAREVALARRLLAAWKKGASAFDREVAAVEAEFKKILHVK